jgi:hypothetical protein
VTIVGTDFVEVAENAYQGMGFGELPIVVVPQDVLRRVIPDVQPACREIMDDIIAGLTKWKPKVKEKKVIMPERIVTVDGANYESAVAKMNELFLMNRWSDGLPLLPATEERVEWLLRGTARKFDEVVGEVGPRDGFATVEVIGTAAAMAGARPEYMPVIIAAVEAMTKPEFRLAELQATTNPVAPEVIVNGPIAKQIGINSMEGCLGPSSEYPAGASIGRAIRLILQNVGGAIPGVTDMATAGQPGKYTGLVHAEAEEELPPAWKPLNIERGFAPGTNTVTVMGVGGTTNIFGACPTHHGPSQMCLLKLARYIGVPDENYYLSDGDLGILLIPTFNAQQWAAEGWSKEDIKKALFEKARLTVSDIDTFIARRDMNTLLRRKPWLKPFVEDRPLDALVPLTSNPEHIIIVVAGGMYHTQWHQCGHGGYKATTIEIELPANWEELLKEAPKFWGK